MDQHFVPECYLRGFADEADNFHFLNIDNLKKGFNVRPKPVNTAGICWQQDYYNILNEYADSSFRFEEYHELFVEQDVFSYYEQSYKGVRDRLISGIEVTSDDILFMCDFIVHLKIRNPYWFRTFFVEKSESMINKIADKSKIKLSQHPLYSQLPPEISDHFVEAHKAMKLTDPHFNKKAFINSLIERRKDAAKNNHATRAALVDASWTVLELPDSEDVQFVTSDNPGFSISPNGYIDNIKIVGEFVFYFPLTSSRCLEISKGVFPNSPHLREGLDYGKLIAPKGMVEKINVFSIERVNQKIIARRPQELLNILKKLKRSRG